VRDLAEEIVRCPDFNSYVREFSNPYEIGKSLGTCCRKSGAKKLPVRTNPDAQYRGFYDGRGRQSAQTSQRAWGEKEISADFMPAASTLRPLILQ